MTKTIIYQMLPRLFGNACTTRVPNGTIEENGCGTLNDITDEALHAIRQLGATHVWYTGIIEHATRTDRSGQGIQRDPIALVKGQAGSPYAIKDYYDIDPDLATDVSRRQQEFDQLISRTHRAGLKAIIDFVPNHVARVYHSDAKPQGVVDFGEGDNPGWAFSPLNNFYYMPGTTLQTGFDLMGYDETPARATGNDVFSPVPSRTDWYDTAKLNYGVFYTGGGEQQFDPIPDTWDKMLDIVKYWTERGIDGFRCDMAEMVPVAFWKWLIPQIRQINPDIIFIAEIYQPDKYRSYIHDGGFDYLYDKVGMYDTLRAIVSSDCPAEHISHCWQATDDIQDHMLYFLENHDEQRIASGFFAGWGGCAQPALIAAATLTRAPFMIYMGQELGERGMDAEGYSGLDGRTTIFDYWSLPCLQAWKGDGSYDGSMLNKEQRGLQAFYRLLLNIAQKNPAISEGQM
ncbi:MAG: alpha-amylase family protein, partial [Paludibacteraceae bacterium]|nr:alpha-amylase family protein [Paludibacteraceae bacterium]